MWVTLAFGLEKQIYDFIGNINVSYSHSGLNGFEAIIVNDED